MAPCSSSWREDPKRLSLLIAVRALLVCHRSPMWITPNTSIARSVTCMGTHTVSPNTVREEIAMMFAHKLRIAAAALSLGIMAFLAPAEARGFGGLRGGISGFHGGGTVRGFGHSRNPAAFMHPSPFRSP